jgi:hypothetical protein
LKEHKDLDITDVYNDLEDIDDTLELDDDTIVDSEEEYTEAGSEPANEYEDTQYEDETGSEPVEEEYEDEEYEEETGSEPVVDDEENAEVEEESNNKKPIIIIILLIIVILIIFALLIKGILSLVGGSKTTQEKSNSTSNVNVEDSDSNIDSNSNEMNDNPDYEIVATFYGNGATLDKYEAMCVTEDKEKGCEISMPDIKREDSEIIGFSTNKNSKTAAVAANGKLTIKEDVTYYAITKANIKATFKYPRGEKKDEVQSCTVYNDEETCKIKFPSYISKGGFDNTWSAKADLTGDMYYAGDTLTIKKSTVFYASYHHPYYGGKSDTTNYHADRKLNITRVVNVGNTRFEYEAGIPEDAINSHIQFINEAYTTTPWIFVPAKVFVLTSESYNKLSIAYGLTFGRPDYNYIDIQYDGGIGAIDDNATIHELAHAWDFYYGYRTGTNLSDQADIKKLYNSLTADQRKNLSVLEWFAGTSTEYYWHYLQKNTEKESFAGFKEFMTEEQQNEYVTMYEKYANKAKNGYR